MEFRHYSVSNIEKFSPPSLWDILVFASFFVLLFFLSKFAGQLNTPYHLGEPIFITLSVKALPGYALKTISRMGMAMCCSLFFTFTCATLAAKNRYAEQIIIPAIDILQSVPVLAFQAISVVPFIRMFPNSLLGPECAAIFAIFTAQAWNMALSFYQSLKTVPADLMEAGNVFQLSAWQKFWRIEVPFAIPSLLWNMMMSMSAGWFFVVASEAISVSNQNITLPGIGSYIATAIHLANSQAVFYAILIMLIVIMMYDQLIFRPLICWSEKFRPLQDSFGETPQSWVLDLIHNSEWMERLIEQGNYLAEIFVNLFKKKRHRTTHAFSAKQIWLMDLIWNIFLSLVLLIGLFYFVRFIVHALTWTEVKSVFILGSFTCLRVFILILLCSVVWIPMGVSIGMHPKAAQWIQPIIQFLAAFPANLLFPAVVALIVRYQLNIEIWTTPLMILGAQWYILFNVIAGTLAIPKDLYQATANFGVKGWLWWKKLILPGIYPYYITGAITASGGAWNASIVAEVVSWGDKTLKATGLGSYISESTTQGDFPRIALGIGVMCFFVLLINRLIWRPLYRIAEKKYQAT